MSSEVSQGPDADRMVLEAFKRGLVAPERAAEFVAMVNERFIPPPPPAPAAVPELPPTTGDAVLDQVRGRLAGFKPSRPGGQVPLAQVYGGIK